MNRKKLRTFANPRCSRLRYRGLITGIILKVQVQTKQPTIYSFFSGPVLNNELFFANGKRLPIFVNQTIEFCILPSLVIISLRERKGIALHVLFTLLGLVARNFVFVTCELQKR